LFVLDDIEEELFNARERIIQISIEKDHLYDSVVDLKQKLGVCRYEKKKIQTHKKAQDEIHGSQKKIRKHMSPQKITTIPTRIATAIREHIVA
jgi:hypothetical protein